MSTRKIRVLLVDENPAIQQALIDRLSREPELELLGNCGYSETEMVLQQVKALKPDVVLFECKRSDGGGLRLCQKVMQLDDKPEVIVFSSFIDDDEWLAARSLGVRRYVLKEIASPALIGEIRAAHAARRQAGYQH